MKMKNSRFTQFKLISTVAILCLSGCVGLPQSEMSPSPQPNELFKGIEPNAGLSEEKITRRWWEIFNDERLNDLIDQAHKKNLDILTAVARIDEARAILAVIDSDQYPKANLEGAYSRQALSDYEPLAQLGAPTQATNTWKLGAAASWEIDFWGYVRYQTQAATERLESIKLDAENVRLITEAELTRIYFIIEGTQQAIAIAQNDRALAQQLVEISRHRQKAGVVCRTETAQAQAELARIQANLEMLEKEKNIGLNALAKILDEPPHALDKKLSDETQTPLPKQIPIGLSSELAEHRPDILSSERNLRAALADIGVAKADFYPRISLTGSIGFQSLVLSDLGSWDSRKFSIGPSFYLPLFEGGRLTKMLELSQARHRTAAIEYRQTVLNAWHEVNNSVHVYLNESRRLNEIALAREQSEILLSVARANLAAGTAAPADVLKVEQKVLANRSQESEANTRRALSIVSLCRALGGGFESPRPADINQ